MRVWVKRLDSRDYVLFKEGDFIPKVVPLLEGDDGNRVGLEDRDLGVCHLEHGLLGTMDVSADGVVAKE